MIIGPRVFQLAGDLPEMVSSEVTSYPNETLADGFVHTLANALYLKYYCGVRAPIRPGSTGGDLLGTLQAANTSVAGWDRGWEILGRDTDGRVVVRSGTRTRLMAAQDVHGPGDHEAADGPVSIRRMREDYESQPGYYYAIGEALGDHYEDHVGARIYLNLKADAAASWMKWVTGELNRHRVPFLFKVLRYLESFVRVDGGILYVPRRHAGFAALTVTELVHTLGGLGPRTPLFTRRIGRGIAMADNPPGGGSFGLSRMTLVAAGHVDAWMRADAGANGRVKAIAARFRAAGVNPARPWLNPGNTEVVLHHRTVRGARSGSGASAATPWLDVADRIGAQLVRDAVWHRDRCNWFGWALVPDAAAGFKPAVCMVGGDLYSGTAGIAMFLARLSAVTQDDRQQAAAVAALRHAIDQTRKGHWQVGAYSGLSGVLHAAIAVAEGCRREEEATVTVRSLVERLSVSRPEDAELDVLDGRAGAVRSLLHAAGKGLDHDGLALGTAVRFGHDIVRLAERRGETWSWNTTKAATTRHLLGYSHGTSGIACALEQLFHVTGERAFRQGADAAWRYETSWFDERERNWPDFRIDDERAAVPATGSEPRSDRFACWWCHGAPGTALALARRIAYVPEDSRPRLEPLLAASLETTIASVNRPPPPKGGSNDASFCLCHGIAGNADILMQIAHLARGVDLHPAVLSAARTGIERHHDSGDWPCGVPGGDQTPGLLLGLAGIGHFYLRLHDASVPSALML